MLPIITVLLFPPSESCQNGNKKHKYTESTGSHGIPIVKKKIPKERNQFFHQDIDMGSDLFYIKVDMYDQ